MQVLIGHAVVLIENYQKLHSRFMQLRCVLSMHTSDPKVGWRYHAGREGVWLTRVMASTCV